MSAVDFNIEQVPLDFLNADPANPRRIGDADLEALTRSLREWGAVQPVVANRDGSLVIAGHQRLLAARRLGWDTIPVIWVDLAPEQAHLLGIALNKISGTWDEQLLARLVSELDQIPDIDLTLTGFADEEVQDLLRSLDARERRDRPETFDLDEALEAATRQSRSKLGDLWLLGDSRLLCGDATRSDDIGRLLGTERAAMAFVDPPYNVDYGRHGGHQAGTPRRMIANDALPPDEWQAFVGAWAATLLGATDGAIYACMSSKEWPTMAGVLAAQGGHWSRRRMRGPTLELPLSSW
jgi:ParB-like chromosome segregation protein Spo0J